MITAPADSPEVTVPMLSEFGSPGSPLAPFGIPNWKLNSLAESGPVTVTDAAAYESDCRVVTLTVGCPIPLSSGGFVVGYLLISPCLYVTNMRTPHSSSYIALQHI